MVHGSLEHGGTRGQEEARRLITYWLQINRLDFDFDPHATQMGDLGTYWVQGCSLFASRTTYSYYQDARVTWTRHCCDGTHVAKKIHEKETQLSFEKVEAKLVAFYHIGTGTHLRISVIH